MRESDEELKGQILNISLELIQFLGDDGGGSIIHGIINILLARNALQSVCYVWL